MTIVVCAVAALAVAMLFYAWRSHHQKLEDRDRTLRERVTYMLWVMANTGQDR